MSHESLKPTNETTRVNIVKQTSSYNCNCMLLIKQYMLPFILLIKNAKTNNVELYLIIQCHTAVFAMSHGSIRYVPRQYSLCHTAVFAMSHGSIRYVTRQYSLCHTAVFAMSHGSIRYVTRQYSQCHCQYLLSRYVEQLAGVIHIHVRGYI